MIKHELDFLFATRRNAISLANKYSIEQLNLTPPSFSNNLIWNLGHMLVTQQLLTYGISGIKPHIDATLIVKYRKGTRPDEFINNEELQLICDLMQETIEMLDADYKAGKFQNFRPYHLQTFNADLTDIDSAITFNNIHEAMHLGYMLSIQKLV